MKIRGIYFVFLGFYLFFAGLFAQAGPVTYLSQKDYENTIGKKCEPGTVSDLVLLTDISKKMDTQGSACKDCLAKESIDKKLKEDSHDLDQISEELFFQMALENKSKQLKCLQNHSTDLLKPANSVVREKILQDYAAKLPLMRDSYRKYQLESQKASDYKFRYMQSVRSNSFKVDLQSHRIYEEHQKAADKFKNEFQAMMASTFEGESKQVQDFLMKYVQAKDFDDKTFKQKAPKEFEQTLQELSKFSEKEQAYWKMKTPLNGYDLSSGDKAKLFHDPQLAALLAENESISGLYCRMEGRYGKGRDSFSQKAMIAEIAVTAVLPIGIYSGVGRALYSMKTARILSAMSLGSYTAYDMIRTYNETCMDHKTVKSTAVCKPVSGGSENILQEIEEGNCALALSMSATNLAGAGIMDKLAQLKGHPGFAKAFMHSSTQKAPRSAKEFNALWKQNTKAEIIQNQKYIRDVRKNDPERLRFYESLGFNFDEKNIVVPDLKDLEPRIHQRLRDAAQKSGLSDEDVLTPKRLIKNEDGSEIQSISVNKDAPAGYSGFMDLLKNKNFIELTARGEWPLGEAGSQAREAQINILMHDLAHVDAFERNPRYMAAIRKNAKQLTNTEISPALASRWHYALEDLVLIKPEKRSEILGMMDRYQLRGSASNDRSLKAYEYNGKLQKLSTPELQSIIQEIEKKNVSWKNSIGGQQNDLTTTERLKDLKPAVYPTLRTNISAMAHSLSVASKNPKVSTDVLRVQLSEYLSAVDHASQIKPEKWMDEISQPHLSKNSSVYRYICDSGVFSPMSAVYEAHCL